jgi:hypothetical protein
MTDLDLHNIAWITWTEPEVVEVSCACGAHATAPDVAKARLWWHLHRGEQAEETAGQ